VKSVIEGLNPKLVWEHFYQISQIPRCSGNEKAVGEYIISVAKRNNLSWKKDEVGNVVAAQPATPGMENRPAVVIQGHMDMVGEKNTDTVHDFTKDPIKLVRDGEWITADGTTLGADNGIAVAMALALMEDKSIVHPPMEYLFTIEEETGLTGAIELKSDFVNGRILLNLDSEEEGALYIGCAGGQDTTLTKKIEWETTPQDTSAYLLKISNLLGGHSGLNIHEGYGNAIKLLARMLYHINGKFEYHIASIKGGSKHNAIPRDAEAVIVIPNTAIGELEQMVVEYDAVYKEELKFIDKDVMVNLEDHDNVKKVFKTSFQDQLIRLLYTIPHGVISMSHAIKGLVETSTNMAICETKEDRIEMLTSQRSSSATMVADISDKVKAIGELAGFQVEQGNGYPAWAPNPDSALLKICNDIYTKKYNSKPEVKAIHAGLECGIIGEHYEGMDMISFGPDLEKVHTPDERIRISSVANIWDYLLEILREIK
jgi:dipeptidase D